MHSELVRFRIDPQIRDKAAKVCEDLGLATDRDQSRQTTMAGYDQARAAGLTPVFVAAAAHDTAYDAVRTLLDYFRERKRTPRELADSALRWQTVVQRLATDVTVPREVGMRPAISRERHAASLRQR